MRGFRILKYEYQIEAIFQKKQANYFGVKTSKKKTKDNRKHMSNLVNEVTG